VCCQTYDHHRDAKSPVSGGRLPYLDVHYGLLYGRTYLPFSLFTYGTSGCDLLHTHAGEAAVLLLDCQAHHCLLIYAVLMQTHDARDVSRKKWRNICKSTKMSTVNSIVVLLSRLKATSTPSARSVRRIYLSPVFYLILELCLPFLNFAGWHLCHRNLSKQFSNRRLMSESFMPSQNWI